MLSRPRLVLWVRRRRVFARQLTEERHRAREGAAAVLRDVERRLALVVLRGERRPAVAEEPDDPIGALGSLSMQSRVAARIRRVDIGALLDTELDRFDRRPGAAAL